MVSSSSTALQTLINNCQLDIPRWISKGTSTYHVQNWTLDFTHWLKPAPPISPPRTHLSNSRPLAAQAKAFRAPHDASFTSHVSRSYWFCFQNRPWIFSTILLLWPPPQQPLNGQLQQHPNQSVSVLPLSSLPFILHTHSSQNDPFKNQVSLYSTPSHGFLFQGDIHYGLLISLLPLTSSLTTFPFAHSFTQAPIVSHVKQPCSSLRALAPLPGMHFYQLLHSLLSLPSGLSAYLYLRGLLGFLFCFVLFYKMVPLPVTFYAPKLFYFSSLCVYKTLFIVYFPSLSTRK